MRCSSGSVSCVTSMTGGWYVWIMLMGRDDGFDTESPRTRLAGLCGGSWPWPSRAASAALEPLGVVLLSGCFKDGEGGAGDGVALTVVAGEFLRGEPPHSDMNERTERAGRSISVCSSL